MNHLPIYEMASSLPRSPEHVDRRRHQPHLKVIYDHFSAGVHKLDEETAVQVADEIASALEYVVVQLDSEQWEKQKFADRMRSRSKAGT